MHRVELSVLRERRVKRHEPEAAAHAASGKESRADRRFHIEIRRDAVAADQIQCAVQIRHELSVRSVGNLAEVVDPRSAVEAWVDG